MSAPAAPEQLNLKVKSQVSSIIILGWLRSVL